METIMIWIMLIALYGGGFFILWYSKNKEKLKTKRAEMNIKKGVNALTLRSEKIEDFLNNKSSENDTDSRDAVDFLKIIQSTFNDAMWVIDSQKATLKTKNRTRDELLSVRGTCDLYVSDKMFYTLDFTRTNIPANGSIEISQNIVTEYANSVGALGSFVGALSKKLGPKTEGRFRNYEIQIAEGHYLFTNPYIRKLAGEKPIEKQKNNYDVLVSLTDTLEGEAREHADSIISFLGKSIKFAEDKQESMKEVWEYIDKYVPTITDAAHSYSLDNSEESKNNLIRTLDIMSQATENFYSKLIESEVDMSEVNQAVMEHQLMREGLYSPYDDEFVE